MRHCFHSIVIAAIASASLALHAHAGGQAIYITSIDELQRIADVNDTAYPLDGSYFLENDIDASGFTGDFMPIGSSSNPFVGTFDGQGFAIQGLTINRPGESNVGLFGVLGSNSRVDRLTLEGGSITGDYFVGAIAGYSPVGTVAECQSTADVSGIAHIGGLVGQNNGYIQYCSASGTVTASTEAAGGLIGRNVGGHIEKSYSAGIVQGGSQAGGLIGYDTSGNIQNCYSVASVSGTDKVGGLVGYFNGTGTTDGFVAYSYAAGPVSGTSEVDGFIGAFTGGTVMYCFFDTAATGQSTSPHAAGYGSSEMMSKASFIGWDFQAVWTISEGATYPYLRHAAQSPAPAPPQIPIDSLDQLQLIGNDSAYPLGGFYVLTTDLDGSGYQGFVPIGSGTDQFKGVFDGRRHVIRNLTINRPSDDNVGLFGAILNGAVRNLRLENISVNGKGTVGALAGALYGVSGPGSVSRCSAIGGVSASAPKAGGLVGYSSGLISECFAAVHVVSTSSSVGGLVGETLLAKIYDSYGIGTVEGTSYVGGLVGYVDDSCTIARTYAAGPVFGDQNTGGLVGKSSSPISQSYWDDQNTGQTTSGGAEQGKTTAEMQSMATFTGWNFDSVWAIREGASFPFLRTFGLPAYTGPADVNGDSYVDAVDVQLAINAALGLAINGNFHPDVNLDRVVDAVDVQLVINAALGV